MQQPPAVAEPAYMRVDMEGPRGAPRCGRETRSVCGPQYGRRTWSGASQASATSAGVPGRVLYVFFFPCESYFMHYGSTKFQKRLNNRNITFLN
jgi:hypothetical protein